MYTAKMRFNSFICRPGKTCINSSNENNERIIIFSKNFRCVTKKNFFITLSINDIIL